MGLELLSIALGARAPGYAYRLQCLLACMAGVSTFAERFRGRDVVIHSDNAGAEHALRKGQLSQLAVATCTACSLSCPRVI